MKFKSLISMMAIAAIVFAGCEEKLPEPENPNQEQPTPEPEPEPEPVVGEITLQGEESLAFSDEGGSQNVAFEATLEWTATSSHEFVTIGPESGEAGEARITVSVEENDSYDARTATVTLTCGEDTKTIHVTQKQKGALLVTESTLSVAAEGGVVTVVAKANSNVTYVIAEDAQSWITTAVAPNGLVEYSFNFEVAANEVEQPRTGQIVFTNEAGSETITITQAGAEPAPVVGEITLENEEALSFPAEGSSQEIAFAATLEWTASSSEEFVSLEPASGEAGEAVVTVTVGKNEAYESRTATVTLTCGEDVKTVTLTQAAAEQAPEYKGEIEDVEDLIEFATLYNAKEVDLTLEVTLMNDLEFDATSSAAYAATGGIGVRSGDNAHYFNGVFNGNNKTIKGYTANIPLFAAVDTYGTVKDLTIDNTSSYTFDAASLDEMGTVVGYHKGLMQNVTVNADITFAAAEIAAAKQIGGLCARVREGQVMNSVYTGHIYVPSSFSASAAKIYIGGITGWISNAAGIITNTQFKGSIDFEGHVASDDRSNPYLMLGGIAGSNSGTVSNCEVFGDKTFTTTLGTYSYDNATIANRSTKSYFSVEGGVVGINAEGGKVQNCVNKANIMNFVLTTGTDNTAADANSRYIFGGGIAGYNDNGEVSGCTNYGYIFSRSTPRLVKFGGIVGRNEGSVANCVNEITGSITVGTAGQKPYSARLPYVGGIIGENTSAAVSNVQNKAPIKISRIEDATGSEIRVGGVLGSTTAEIDGTSAKNISNSGAIAIENGISSVTLGLFEGGVVGYTTASIKNVKNTGALSHKQTTSLQKLYLSGVVGSVVSTANVEISGCENEGEVYFQAATASKDGEVEYTNNFLGGVLAYSTSDVTVSDCQNGGYVHGGNSTKLNTKTLYVGGVVGYLMGKSSIVSCVNTGKVYNDHSNNSQDKALSVYAGGVVAFVEGTEANCSNKLLGYYS